MAAQYSIAKVTEVINDQSIRLEDKFSNVIIQTQRKFNVNQKVILAKPDTKDSQTFYIVDTFRLDSVAIVTFVVFVTAIIFARAKGIGAIIGLTLSILVLSYFTVPSILAGKDPIFISLISSIFVGITSLYLAHGVSKRTTIALLSTIASLAISTVAAWIAVQFTGLSGLGSEEAMFLTIGQTTINLQGLLLGGIIIGAMGVLDDITTAQTATLVEIHKANPRLGFSQLMTSGLNVGKEHIASLINTLVFAYSGASLPMFVLFHINNTEPFWVTLNNEFIIEEVVRTLVGSFTLILAVPISTLFACLWLTNSPDL